MLKLWKFTVAATAAVIGAAAFGSASAQVSNAPLGGVMNLISASDVTSMMTEMQVSTQIQQTTQGQAYVVARTPGGGEFRFGFVGCQDQAQAVGCQGAFVIVPLAAGGATFDDVNNFNSNAVVSTAVALPEDNVIAIGRNILIAGGHSRALFKTTVALFLHDVASFAQMNTGAASVSYERPKSKATKISPLQAGNAPKGPISAFGVKDMKSVVSMAIANTNDVDFTVNYTPDE